MSQGDPQPVCGDDSVNLGDDESNALIDAIMQGTASSGDILDLDLLLSGVVETQSEPSATPARYILMAFKSFL